MLLHWYYIKLHPVIPFFMHNRTRTTAVFYYYVTYFRKTIFIAGKNNYL